MNSPHLLAIPHSWVNRGVAEKLCRRKGQTRAQFPVLREIDYSSLWSNTCPLSHCVSDELCVNHESKSGIYRNRSLLNCYCHVVFFFLYCESSLILLLKCVRHSFRVVFAFDCSRIYTGKLVQKCEEDKFFVRYFFRVERAKIDYWQWSIAMYVVRRTEIWGEMKHFSYFCFKWCFSVKYLVLELI